jgi:hypothetical protein
MLDRFIGIIAEAKDNGCADCGNKDHRVLEFHHKAGEYKLANVTALRARSEKVVREEIQKCDVLCANCHAIRHYNAGLVQR